MSVNRRRRRRPPAPRPPEEHHPMVMAERVMYQMQRLQRGVDVAAAQVLRDAGGVCSCCGLRSHALVAVARTDGSHQAVCLKDFLAGQCDTR